MIELPWPPSSLSGHAKGFWYGKHSLTVKHRGWARSATLAAGVKIEGDGDIPISVYFYPPDNRGDRVNFPNRMKPLFDGIADALGINDKRFLPSYHFCQPEKHGKVIVTFPDTELRET